MRLHPIKTLLFKSAIAINCILALIFGYAILIYGLASPEYRPGAKPTDIIAPIIVFAIAVFISIILPILIKQRETKTTRKTTIAILFAYCPIIGIILLLISDTLKSCQANKRAEKLVQMWEKKNPKPEANIDGFSISREINIDFNT
jgi:uncharacterized membrane protein